MAITLVTSGTGTRGFIANGNTSDLSGCEQLVAAVTGKSVYLERLTINFGAALNVTVGAGETTGAVTTVIVGPVYGAANSTVDIKFDRPVKLAAATALVADASGSGNVTIIAQGWIE